MRAVFKFYSGFLILTFFHCLCFGYLPGVLVSIFICSAGLYVLYGGQSNIDQVSHKASTAATVTPVTQVPIVKNVQEGFNLLTDALNSPVNESDIERRLELIFDPQSQEFDKFRCLLNQIVKLKTQSPTVASGLAQIANQQFGQAHPAGNLQQMIGQLAVNNNMDPKVCAEVVDRLTHVLANGAPAEHLTTYINDVTGLDQSNSPIDIPKIISGIIKINESMPDN